MESFAGDSSSNNRYGSTKKFFVHTLEHLATGNVITPYTWDKLANRANSESKKDYSQAKKHIIDLRGLYDTFQEDARETTPPSAYLPPTAEKGKAKKGRLKQQQFPPEHRP